MVAGRGRRASPLVLPGACSSPSSSGTARYHRRVRKLIKLAIIAFGIRAFMRWRKSRQQAEATPPTQETSDPADELRRKLAESRDDTADAAASPPEAAVADRRAEVHEAGREALDEMTPSDEA